MSLQVKSGQAKMSPVAVLTRPSERNQTVSSQLNAMGWSAFELPLLGLTLLDLSQGQVAPDPARFDLVVFASRFAVDGYARQLGSGYLWPESCVIATVGASTAHHVKTVFGGHVDVIYPDGDQNDSESLWVVLQKHLTSLKHVLFVRGQTGRDWLIEQMTSVGITTIVHTAYRREMLRPDEARVSQIRQYMSEGRPVVWLLTSARSIDTIFEPGTASHASQWLGRCSFIVTHEKFRFLLQRHLVKLAGADARTTIRVCRPDDSSIVDCFLTLLEAPNTTIAT